jgi:hypothetical protein
MTGGEITGNPIFTGALGMYNNTIIRESEQIARGVSNAGVAQTNVRRAVFMVRIFTFPLQLSKNCTHCYRRYGAKFTLVVPVPVLVPSCRTLEELTGGPFAGCLSAKNYVTRPRGTASNSRYRGTLLRAPTCDRAILEPEEGPGSWIRRPGAAGSRKHMAAAFI